MKVGDFCKRAVVTVDTNASIVDVAKTMRNEHVGFVIVVQEGDPKREPVGVITDRDIVVQVCARDVAEQDLTAQDVMSRQPLVARDIDDLNDLLKGMRLSGFRRVPVVTNDRTLVGIIAIDDMLDIVAEMICDLSGAIRNEQRQERRLRRQHRKGWHPSTDGVTK